MTQIFYLPTYNIFCLVTGDKVEFALRDSGVVGDLATQIAYFGDCMTLATDFIWICAL